MNSACLSTNLPISHGHATLSTRGCSRVIHFMVVLPKTPAAAIGSIAEVTQNFLIYVVGALLAAAIVAAVLYWRYPWSRPRGRLGTAAIATFVAWILWRVVLELSGGENLDVDNPLLLGLSAQDVGSGVLAFLFTALPIGLVRDRDEPAHHVVATAAIAGALAILVDRFI